MKKRKVIAQKNFSMRSPLMPTVVVWLLLDRFQAPGWVWGVVGTLVAILWIAFVAQAWTNEITDIFEQKD